MEKIYCNTYRNRKKISNNKNSFTDDLKLVAFSVSFIKLPHGFVLMVEIMNVFLSPKIPKGHCP
jgi:hypothetical protein